MSKGTEVGRRAAGLGAVVSALVSGSLLHPIVSGQSGVAVLAGKSHYLGGNLLEPAIASALLAIVLGLVWVDAISLEDAVDVAPNRETIGSVLIVGLLLSASMGTIAPPVSAQTTTAGAVPVAESNCTLQGLGALIPGLGIEACEPIEVDKNETQADLYASGVELRAQTDAQTTSINNNLQSARSHVLCKIRADVIESRKNGLNKSEANESARSLVKEHYFSLFQNLKNSKEIEDNVTYRIFNTSQQENINGFVYGGGDGDGFAEVTDYRREEAVNTVGPDSQYIWYPQNVTFKRAYIDTGGTESGYNAPLWKSRGYRSPSPTVKNVKLENPATGNRVRTTNYQNFYNANENIDDNFTDLNSTAGVFVNGVYEKYNQSEIEDVPVSELQSACSLSTLAQAGDAGGYAEARAAAAVLGFNTSVNSSMTVQYRPITNESTNELQANNTTLEGGLFTDWRPAKTNGSFVKGTTYNTSNSGKTVYFVAQSVNGSAPDNGSKTYRLRGEFTVGEITNVRTGESLNSTNPREQVPSTADSSNLLEDVNKILDYRNQVQENYEPTGTGGGGSGDSSGGSIFDTLALGTFNGLVALAVVGLIMLAILSE